MATHWQDLRDQSVLDELNAKFKRKFEPKTPGQATYLEALQTKTIVVCASPAGCGKTYMACGYAARALKEGKFEKVIVTRPIVPCGRGYGFRPGTIEEKVLPTMRPLLDAFSEFLGVSELGKLIENGTIEILPLDDMRGCSLPRSCIICDEAQNAERNQLHMLLTRFGEGSKVILTGDVNPTQTDIKFDGVLPLLHVIQSFELDCHKDVAIVRMTRKDVVRHPLIKWIDTRLVGETEQKMFKCPACGDKCWYEADAEEGDSLVRCWRCKRVTELLDEHDQLRPVVIQEWDGVPAETYPEKT